MRLSDVDLSYIKDYCGVADDDYDSDRLLESNLNAAKSFILNATGLASWEADQYDDLTIALQKASTALQYTVAIRDRLLDAYKEIMQMQI